MGTFVLMMALAGDEDYYKTVHGKLSSIAAAAALVSFASQDAHKLTLHLGDTHVCSSFR